MTGFEQCQEHIQYTHNAYCNIVIRHKARFFTACGLTVMLDNEFLAAMLFHLPEHAHKEIFTFLHQAQEKMRVCRRE